MQKTEVLGENLRIVGYSCKGHLTKEMCAVLNHDIIAKIRMTPAHQSVFYRYPVEGGKGGVGFTLIQPITESFIAWDVWPDLGGAYLIICSCRWFNQATLVTLLEEHGLTVKKTIGIEMGIEDKTGI